MNVLLFGAGASGRGHLTPRMLDFLKCHITYVDKNKKIVEALKDRSFEVVQLDGKGGKRICEVSDYDIVHNSEQDKINLAFAKADIVLTCVIAENLEDVAEKISASIKCLAAANKDKKFNVVACENLNHASSVLKNFVNKRLDPESVKYSENHIAFPDAVISRVVPVPENLYRIVCEDYNEWYADAHNWKGDPSVMPFIGVSGNLDALLERKLWIHNGGHAALGYAAWRAHYRYIHEAVRDTELAAFTVMVMREIGNCIIHKYGFDADGIKEYEAELGRRGAIEEIKDEVSRVIRDPIRKLKIGDRITGPLVYAYTNRLKYDGLVKAIVNILNYYDPGDSESVAMKKTIETEGIKAFLSKEIKLGTYPELIDKIKEAYEK